MSNEIKAEHKKQIDKDNAILKQVETMVSAKDFEDIKAELKEDGYVYDFSIVDEPNGDKQNDEAFENGFSYVDQSSGSSCDSYYGTVCIPVSQTQFFRFNFSI